MGHTSREKNKILARVNRLKGQLEAFSKAVEAEKDCYEVMQLLASCRGAINGLMGELVEDHIQEHIVSAPTKKDAVMAGKETLEIMKSFWK